MNPATQALSRFREVTLRRDAVPLPDDVRQALPHLVRAMEGIDRVYRMQQDEGLPALFDKVMASNDEEMKAFFRFFNGPWNSLEEHRSVLPGTPDRARGCAFYPADLTREEWDSYLATCSPDAKEALTSEYTVVRRAGKELRAIPFHEHYADELKVIAGELRKAADLVQHEGLKSYLRRRATSLLDGGYRDCDAEWVRLKETPLELVCGPYEVYEDQLIGIKAAYEARLMAVDPEKARTLHEIAGNLAKLSALFPLPDGSKASVGGLAPMVVVHQLGGAGEGAQGVMASAFNLPNDPWVRGEVGWKQIMIYNVMQAKFETCTRPIAERVLEAGPTVEFDPYFYLVLLHEVSHGLGPAYRKNGESVSKSLGKSYTSLEEAKADIGGLCLMLHMGGSCGLPSIPQERLLRNYIGGLFRSMRFGVHEAHGMANVVEFNWMRRRGVIVPKGGRFAIEARNIREAADALLAELCRLQASASVAEAEAFLAEFGKPGEEITGTIAGLADIPVDIRAKYA